MTSTNNINGENRKIRKEEGQKLCLCENSLSFILIQISKNTNSFYSAIRIQSKHILDVARLPYLSTRKPHCAIALRLWHPGHHT